MATFLNKIYKPFAWRSAEHDANSRQHGILKNGFSILIVILLSIIYIQIAIAQTTNIKGVRIWHAPDHSRVVFDMSEKADYNISLLQQPSRYVIDFNKARKSL